MCPKRTNKPEEIHSDGSAISGDLSIENGKVVGRDQLGLDGKDVSEIIAVLLSHFSKDFLKSPEKLDQFLRDIMHCQDELYEWKALHNYLDTTLQSFGQFETSIPTTKKREPRVSDIRPRWNCVDIMLGEMLRWGECEMKIIGPTLDREGYNVKSGPDWAINLVQQRKKIEEHILYGEAYEQEFNKANTISRLFIKNQLDNYWFERLQEYASEYRSLVLHYMGYADGHLRETATKLIFISRASLRGY